MPVIEIKNLTKQYAVRGHLLRAVSDFSLSIYPGEIVGLAGESGCGKSTVGKMLARLVSPSSGSIFFAGTPLNALQRTAPLQLCQDIQLIFQNPTSALNPKMTIEQILTEPFAIHQLEQGQARRQRILQLLDQVGLPTSYLKRLPHELSGGQKQRVNIARALALRPKFLICDEPLAALDVSIQAQIIALLQQLRKELQITYLFISHDLSVMRHFTDRIAVMYFGQLVELAPTQALFDAPQHPYTKALLSAIPLADPRLERGRPHLPLTGELPSPFTHFLGCPFQTRCPFVMPLCQTVHPKRQKRQDRWAACHFSAP